MTRLAKHDVSDRQGGTDGHPIPCEPAPVPPVDPKDTDALGDGGDETEGHPRPARQS
jgi:hypothetical protein